MLKHHGHACGPRGSWFCRRKVFARQLHGTVIRTHQTIDHFHQSRFSRTVFTEQRMNFTCVNIEAHVIIGDHAGIGFCEPIDVQKRLTHRRAFLLVVTEVLRNNRA